MSEQGQDLGVELSDMIEQLRLELGAAMGEGDGQALRFVAESVELELKLNVVREGKGKAGIKFWVVNAGVEGAVKHLREQTLKLKLTPRDVSGSAGDALSADGKPGTVALISQQTEQRREGWAAAGAAPDADGNSGG